MSLFQLLSQILGEALWEELFLINKSMIYFCEISGELLQFIYCRLQLKIKR